MTKILVAEDDTDIRELIVLTLQFNGFGVVQAEDGQQAVDIAAAGDIDLILMDVRMPRMTGFQACEKLKTIESTKDIPVIFLSAKGQESEIATGLQAGAADYLLKPFAPDELIKTIKRVLKESA